MQKEKKVRTYQRRTKTGKLVTVRQHTAKYDAAEKAKEMLKKKGAGDELSAKKKAKPVSSAGELDFSQADFKAWYHWDQENDPKNPAALKVEKALKAKMGARAYRKYFNDMSDSYSARGHIKAYKECSACGDKGKADTKTAKVKEPKTSKSEASPKKSVDTPKGSAKGTRMRGEKEGERDSYYGTGTLDAKYAEAVKAAKSGDVKAYRKAVGAYGEVYSHHGDHFGDRASMNYREKQTKVLEGLAAKMGVDYWGNKEAPKVSDKKFSTAAKEWGVSSEAMRYWYEEGMGKSPKKPSSSVMKEVRRLDKMVDKTFGMPLVKHLDSQASETTNVYAYALKKSQKEILALRDKIEGKTPNKTKSKVAEPKSSGKTPSKVAERYANEAGEEKVIAFMESNYRCTYNKKTGKFDFDGANFGRGHTLKSRSRTMEDARKTYAEKLQAYNELKAKDDPYIKNHIRNAKRQGWFINIPSKELADKSSSKASKSSEKTTKAESKSKRLRRELAEAEAEESRSAVKSATRKSEAAFEKAGVSRKDVSAFMKSSPRKWTYDREEGVYKTMVMPDGKGRARGAYKMSVAAAIKKFKEAKKTKLPAHYVNRYKKEMSKLPESEWEKFF